jgi:hypothetical protein
MRHIDEQSRTKWTRIDHGMNLMAQNAYLGATEKTAASGRTLARTLRVVEHVSCKLCVAERAKQPAARAAANVKHKVVRQRGPTVRRVAKASHWYHRGRWRLSRGIAVRLGSE